MGKVCTRIYIYIYGYILHGNKKKTKKKKIGTAYTGVETVDPVWVNTTFPKVDIGPVYTNVKR